MITQAQAEAIAREMWAAHGRRIDKEVVDQYAKVILDAKCVSCAVKVFEIWRTEKTVKGNMPDAPTLRFEIREMTNSVEHGTHVGQDATAVSVSELETAWHTDGVAAIKAAAGVPDAVAQLMAARMWASGAVPVAQAGAEATAPIWAVTGEQPTSDLITAAWDYARALATTPAIEMTDGEWKAANSKLEAASS